MLVLGACEVLGESGAVEVLVLQCVIQAIYFTSQSRKDLVVVKVSMLDRSSCRPKGDTGHKVSLVLKLGWGTVMVLISISRRLMSLVATSCLSTADSLVSNWEKTATLLDMKVRWCRRCRNRHDVTIRSSGISQD